MRIHYLGWCTRIGRYGADILTCVQERVERLLSQTYPIGLATEIRKFYPHLHIFLRRYNQCSDFEHSLPNFDVSLASFQSLHPSMSHCFLFLRVAVVLFVRNDLL